MRLPLDGYRRLVLSLLVLGCCASVSLADPKPDIAGLRSGPIVVNATPLGMHGDDPLPVDSERLTPGTWVGDVVMSDQMTPFLIAAQARGCPVQVGIDMLFEQIPAYLEFFGFPTTTPEHLKHLAGHEPTSTEPRQRSG